MAHAHMKWRASWPHIYLMIMAIRFIVLAAAKMPSNIEFSKKKKSKGLGGWATLVRESKGLGSSIKSQALFVLTI